MDQSRDDTGERSPSNVSGEAAGSTGTVSPSIDSDSLNSCDAIASMLTKKEYEKYKSLVESYSSNFEKEFQTAVNNLPRLIAQVTGTENTTSTEPTPGLSGKDTYFHSMVEARWKGLFVPSNDAMTAEEARAAPDAALRKSVFPMTVSVAVSICGRIYLVPKHEIDLLKSDPRLFGYCYIKARKRMASEKLIRETLKPSSREEEAKARNVEHPTEPIGTNSGPIEEVCDTQDLPSSTLSGQVEKTFAGVNDGQKVLDTATAQEQIEQPQVDDISVGVGDISNGTTLLSQSSPNDSPVSINSSVSINSPVPTVSSVPSRLDIMNAQEQGKGNTKALTSNRKRDSFRSEVARGGRISEDPPSRAGSRANTMQPSSIPKGLLHKVSQPPRESHGIKSVDIPIFHTNALQPATPHLQSAVHRQRINAIQLVFAKPDPEICKSTTCNCPFVMSISCTGILCPGSVGEPDVKSCIRISEFSFLQGGSGMEIHQESGANQLTLTACPTSKARPSTRSGSVQSRPLTAPGDGLPLRAFTLQLKVDIPEPTCDLRDVSLVIRHCQRFIIQ